MASNGHSPAYERANVGRPPYGRDKIPEMQVIVDAKALQRHSYTKVRNQNIFPKKDRMLSDLIFSEACAVVVELTTANDYRLDDPKERELRLSAQRSALRNLRLLIANIELSHEILSGLDDNAFSFWAKMAASVKNQAAAWYKSDKQRAGNL